MAIAGAHLGEDEGDLGQRLLAAGKHLGIADRRRQRQEAKRQLDPFDPVAGIGGGAGVGRRLGVGNGVGFDSGHESSYSGLIPAVLITRVQRSISDATNLVYAAEPWGGTTKPCDSSLVLTAGDCIA